TVLLRRVDRRRRAAAAHLQGRQRLRSSELRPYRPPRRERGEPLPLSARLRRPGVPPRVGAVAARLGAARLRGAGAPGAPPRTAVPRLGRAPRGGRRVRPRCRGVARTRRPLPPRGVAGRTRPAAAPAGGVQAAPRGRRTTPA